MWGYQIRQMRSKSAQNCMWAKRFSWNCRKVNWVLSKHPTELHTLFSWSFFTSASFSTARSLYSLFKVCLMPSKAFSSFSLSASSCLHLSASLRLFTSFCSWKDVFHLFTQNNWQQGSDSSSTHTTYHKPWLTLSPCSASWAVSCSTFSSDCCIWNCNQQHIAVTRTVMCVSFLPCAFPAYSPLFFACGLGLCPTLCSASNSL